jgi:hypothetical protein
MDGIATLRGCSH